MLFSRQLLNQAVVSLVLSLFVVELRAAPTSAVNTEPLSFETAVAGMAQFLSTSPEDSRAAVFQVSGDANAVVNITVKENFIYMRRAVQGPSHKLKVHNFILGGSVNRNGNAVLDSRGQLVNVRVGASVEITNQDAAGSYSGQATLRIVYQ